METKDSQNKRRYKMALLFIQTKELKKLYYSEMENSPRNYNLVNKEWLDNYKDKNNYKYAITLLNSFEDWKDYSEFKHKISKYFQIEENNFTQYGADDALDNIMNFSLQKENISNYISYPTNCELVKIEFFNDCSKGSVGFPQYNVWIGNKLIIINDSETNNVLFLCSLIDNQENINNCLIKINYILAFQNEEYMKNEINQIIISKDLNKYLYEKK